VADPELASQPRAPDDLALVLASDGLYEKLDLADVVAEVRKAAPDKTAQQTVASIIVAQAQAAATADNIAAVVLWLK